MSTDTDDEQLSNFNSGSANMRPVCSVSPYLRDKPEVPSTSSIRAGPRSTPVPNNPTGPRSPSTPSVRTSSESSSSEPRAESVSVQSSDAPSGTQTQHSLCTYR